MKTTAPAILATLAFLLVSCGEKKPGNVVGEVSADGSVVLAKKDFLPATGTVLTKDEEMKMEDGPVSVSAGGQEMTGTMSRTSVSKETIEILAADKFRRLLVSKDESGEMKLNGQKQPTPGTPDPLLTLPVILKRDGGKWSAALENGIAPEANQQKRLDAMAKEANRDSDFAMYGDAPRKPGDKWEVDPAKLSNFGDVENLTGKFTVQFLNLEEFKGDQCALLKSTFELKGKSAPENGAPTMDLVLKGSALSRRSITKMVDLDSQIDATMIIDGTPAPNVTMHMEGPMKMSEKITVKTP